MALKKVWRATRGKAKKDVQEREYDDYITDAWFFLISFFRWYPDVMGDIFRSDEAQYQWELIQRVMIRAFERNQYVDITGCRSATKTTCKIFQKSAHNLMWLGIKSSYYGPSYKQQAELAATAFADLTRDYPVIASHYKIKHEANDNWEIYTQYNSRITINAVRGKNIHDVTAEEYAQEENPAFDHKEYSTVVLYAVRNKYRVGKKEDPNFIKFQQHSITSATSKLNPAYLSRRNHLKLMIAHNPNEKAFVMDIPWEVIVLSQMRSYEWAMQRKADSTASEWMREMCSRYTGSSENPIIREEDLAESRNLLLMEEHHCCKDRDNKIKPKDVIYIVAYDVSYEDSIMNAKCACGVVKCTKQKDWFKRDKYLKQLVWLDDWAPMDAMLQARKLKEIWYRFCYEGSETYIVVDGWAYGKAVIESLMQDLGDGLNPLCIYDHDQYVPYELEGAIPIIYPIKAGGAGATDPDSEMVRNAQTQFANHNVQLLTSDEAEGVKTYKQYHRIKDDYADVAIAKPFKKTKELVSQIQNLKQVPSGNGISERRITPSIQRDSWSALKYALRFAQKLERLYLVKQKSTSDWAKELEKYQNGGIVMPAGGGSGRMITRRMGGRHYE